MTAKAKKKITPFHILTILISSAFFLGIALVDGPVWCVDSNSYVTMDFTREPVYPLFLMVLKNIFKETVYRNDLPLYLFVAAMLQSLLWVYVSCRVAFFAYSFSDSWNLSAKKKAPYIAGFFALLFQLAVPAFNRFLIKRQSMYSESIMTESLAMPLFALIVLRLFMWYRDYKKKDLIILCMELLLIISIRKQMMVMVILWGAVSFLYDVILKGSRSIKRFLMTVVLSCIIFLSANLIDRYYNYSLRGVFVTHTGNHQGELCTLIYTASGEDIELFDENTAFPNEKDLFERILTECANRNLLYETHDAADWKDLTSHYSDSYDIIGYDILMPMCYEYVDKNYPGIDDVKRRLIENEIEGDLASHLLKQEKGDLIDLYLSNLLRAFVYSNASMHPDVIIYASLGFYALYLLLFVLLFIISIIKNKKGRGVAHSNASYRDVLLFSIIVIFALSINSGVVAALIFPQGRYMIYSTALFYTSLLLMTIRTLTR